MRLYPKVNQKSCTSDMMSKQIKTTCSTWLIPFEIRSTQRIVFVVVTNSMQSTCINTDNVHNPTIYYNTNLICYTQTLCIPSDLLQIKSQIVKGFYQHNENSILFFVFKFNNIFILSPFFCDQLRDCKFNKNKNKFPLVLYG